MKCVIPNNCKKKFLCCNFCKNKNCDERCKDDFKKCIYFLKIKCNINNIDDCNYNPLSKNKM